MTSVAVLVFKNQGEALNAIHLTAEDASIEVFELIPLASRAQVLLKGPSTQLMAFLGRFVAGALVGSHLIENWDARIERAFYSLDHAKPAAELMVLEGPSLGEALWAAQTALQSGLQVVDLKIPRGSVEWATLVLTGDQYPEGWDPFAVGPNLQLTRISQPSQALRQYFDIEA